MKSNPVKGEDLEQGNLLVKRGIPSLHFSERTYQVEVPVDLESDETYWVFLGLSDSNEPTDYFCTCERFEEAESCPHLAASILSVFDSHGVPLHERYKHSLWYILFFIASRRHGFTPHLDPIEGGFQIKSSKDKVLFTLRAKSERGRAKLDEMVFNREKETEENSIKFSHLSAEEMTLYREGRPSIQLQFELSLWSDLSKWLAVMEAQGEACQITCPGDGSELPQEMAISFPDVEISLYIAKANWPELLMFLKGGVLPLPIHHFRDYILKKITYDSQERTLILEKKPLDLGDPSDWVDLGDWVFSPSRGFFPKDSDSLFDGDRIEGNAITEIFRKYPDLLKEKMVGTPIDFEVHQPQYHLVINEKGTLTISLYIDEPGDMNDEEAYFFSPWGYTPHRGFFKFSHLVFEEVEKIVPRDKISEFITHYRTWLSNFEGFSTHLTSMESQLSYDVKPDRSLVFTTDELKESSGMVDLGEWLYIERQGFFPKHVSSVHSFLKPGMTLSHGDISGFIRSHEPELELIQNFFADRCPVAKMGLKVAHNDQGVIEVEPIVHYAAGYEAERVIIFNEYAYVRGEGFSRIPESALLPAGYDQPKEIPSFLEQHFLFNELEDLKPHIFEIDSELKEAHSLSLYISHIDYSSKTGRWKLQVHLQSEHGSAPFSDLYFALTTMKPFLISSAGLVLLKEPRFDWIKGVSEKQLKGKELTISSMEWIRLCVYEQVVFDQGCDPKLVEMLRQFNAPNLEELPAPSLTGFKTDLRPYQEIGVKWIWNLYLNHLAGILADEMGLGKTHQAMGLIAAASQHEKGAGAQFFVVCPTSVLYHWDRSS